MLTIEISPSDRHILDTLETMLTKRCPTWGELARKAGVSSNQVRDSMQRLNRIGLVSWNPCLPRELCRAEL